MKNKIILLFCLFILFSSCKSLNAVEIGDNIPAEVQNNADEKSYTLLNAATVLPLYNYSEYISLGGENGVVEFIKDKTPGKLFGKMKVGDKILPGSDLFMQIQAEIGVGFYIPTDTGWNAFIGDSNTEEKGFTVLFFFKKKISPDAGFFMTYEEYKTWVKQMDSN